VEKRANARCIKCGSLERHRMLWLYLHEETSIFSKGLKVLHIAPEKQLYDLFLQNKNIDYYPIDLDAKRYGKKTEEMDATQMRYPDAFFDVVICNHVLEHIPNDRKAMSEIFRVLKEGGWGLLNVPWNRNINKTFEDFSIIDPKERERVFGQCDHVRIYGNDYIERLTETGFKVKVTDYVSKFSHNEQFHYGLKNMDLIFHCSKPVNSLV
jgi:SAM-dependent methyltransferase